MRNSETKASRGWDFLRKLTGIRARYESLERLANVQRQLRKIDERLRRLDSPEHGLPGPRIMDQDASFVEAVAAVIERTKLDRNRLWILWQSVRNTAPLQLPILEAGSFRGGSAYFLARAYVECLGHELPLEAIDTFEGHPAGALSAQDHPVHVAGLFGRTNYEEVTRYLSAFSLTRAHKGEFSSVAPTLEHALYGLVHLDMDLYVPTLEALEFCADRVPPGGVIVLDDYGAPKCPGVRSAAEEFLREHSEFQPWHPHTEQLVLVRVRWEEAHHRQAEMLGSTARAPMDETGHGNLT